MSKQNILMSLQMYDALTNNIESSLDEADKQAEETDVRYSHEEVFNSLRAKSKRLHSRKFLE